MTVLHTERLRLEPLDDRHFEQLHALNRDPEVMRYITGKPDSPQDTWAMIERVKARWVDWGYSWWAFVELGSAELIGAGCIQHLGRDSANPLEIGWRLRRDRWHQGFASEAAQAMASFAFDTLNAPLLTAVCDPANAASAHVMTRLGMSYRGIEHWYDAELATYAMSADDWRVRALPQGRLA
ncbi:MAG TPA: GNAT family N-acetyltransferase [Burkholderiaceae bacterium]